MHTESHKCQNIDAISFLTEKVYIVNIKKCSRSRLMKNCISIFCWYCRFVLPPRCITLVQQTEPRLHSVVQGQWSLYRPLAKCHEWKHCEWKWKEVKTKWHLFIQLFIHHWRWLVMQNVCLNANKSIIFVHKIHIVYSTATLSIKNIT